MMMRWIWAACWTALSLPVTAESPALRFSRAIERNASDREEIVAVPIDSSVYAATRDGFPDLRIFDEGGAETPFLLEKSRESRSENVRISQKAELVSLKQAEGNRIEVHLRLGKDSPAAEGVTVVTPLSNFEHRVGVSGSADDKHWIPLVENAAIYDYSRYMDVSNREIPLPANAYRQLKVVIEEALQTRESEFLELTRKLRGGEEAERRERTDIRRVPLRIDRIELWHQAIRTLPAVGRKFEYAIVSFIAQAGESRSTIIDVKTRREPLTGLSLQTTSRNFSRTATVQVPVRRGVQTEWREIGRATLQAVHFRDIHRERLVIAFPEQRQEHYRVVIYNEDNPPLDVIGIKAEGPGYRLLFLASPDKAYSLHYGAETIALPRYDAASIREAISAGYLPTEARLGPEVASAPAARAGFDFARLLNSRLFLVVVVILTVVVLAGALFRAGRRMDQWPRE